MLAGLYNNWGNNICKFAKTNKDGNLFKESFEKYQRAIELKPKFASAYNNWASALISYSYLLNGEAKEKALDEALELAKKAYDLDGSTYNLACIYALKKDKEKALEYLESSIKNKQIEIKHVLADDDWKEYLEDAEFKEIIKKHQKDGKE